MIFLRENELLETEIQPDHIKPRLLGASIVLTPDLDNAYMSRRPLGDLPWNHPGLVSPESSHTEA
jgi:hypothetical protein